MVLFTFSGRNRPSMSIDLLLSMNPRHIPRWQEWYHGRNRRQKSPREQQQDAPLQATWMSDVPRTIGPFTNQEQRIEGLQEVVDRVVLENTGWPSNTATVWRPDLIITFSKLLYRDAWQPVNTLHALILAVVTDPPPISVQTGQLSHDAIRVSDAAAPPDPLPPVVWFPAHALPADAAKRPKDRLVHQMVHRNREWLTTSLSAYKEQLGWQPEFQAFGTRSPGSPSPARSYLGNQSTSIQSGSRHMSPRRYSPPAVSSAAATPSQVAAGRSRSPHRASQRPGHPDVTMGRGQTSQHGQLHREQPLDAVMAPSSSTAATQQLAVVPDCVDGGD